LLREARTALIVTGTSVVDPDPEKTFTLAARQVGIPSLAVLDFWSNYRQRFSDSQGRLVYLPDKIAVMDAEARDEMIAQGFDGQQLLVTGQPAFDDLADWRVRFTPSHRQALRESLGLAPGERMVLFLSQPFSIYYGEDDTHPGYLGFDERSVWRQLLVALEEIARSRRENINLTVCPHPKDDPAWYRRFRSSDVSIRVETGWHHRDLALAADLVCGMTSTALFEACCLGCVTASLLPGLRVPDDFPPNRRGWSRAVYQPAQVRPVVEELLLDTGARQAAQAGLGKLVLDGGATGRVVDLIYSLAGLG